MNTRVRALCGLATILAAGAAFGVSAQTPIAPAASPDLRMAQRGRERHPELRAALTALRNAKDRLERAAHDYGGHRVKAIEHTNEAIREVERAIDFDKH